MEINSHEPEAEAEQRVLKYLFLQKSNAPNKIKLSIDLSGINMKALYPKVVSFFAGEANFLHEISLKNCKLTTLNNLPRLKYLNTLNLEGNSLNDLGFLSEENFPNLRSVNLNNNKSLSSPAQLKHLSSFFTLKEVSLIGCGMRMSRDVIKSIRSMLYRVPNIKVLDNLKIELGRQDKKESGILWNNLKKNVYRYCQNENKDVLEKYDAIYRKLLLLANSINTDTDNCQLKFRSQKACYSFLDFENQSSDEESRELNQETRNRGGSHRAINVHSRKEQYINDFLRNYGINYQNELKQKERCYLSILEERERKNAEKEQYLLDCNHEDDELEMRENELYCEEGHSQKSPLLEQENDDEDEGEGERSAHLGEKIDKDERRINEGGRNVNESKRKADEGARKVNESERDIYVDESGHRSSGEGNSSLNKEIRDDSGPKYEEENPKEIENRNDEHNIHSSEYREKNVQKGKYMQVNPEVEEEEDKSNQHEIKRNPLDLKGNEIFKNNLAIEEPVQEKNIQTTEVGQRLDIKNFGEPESKEEEKVACENNGADLYLKKMGEAIPLVQNLQEISANSPLNRENEIQPDFDSGILNIKDSRKLEDDSSCDAKDISERIFNNKNNEFGAQNYKEASEADESQILRTFEISLDFYNIKEIDQKLFSENDTQADSFQTKYSDLESLVSTRGNSNGLGPSRIKSEFLPVNYSLHDQEAHPKDKPGSRNEEKIQGKIYGGYEHIKFTPLKNGFAEYSTLNKKYQIKLKKDNTPDMREVLNRQLFGKYKFNLKGELVLLSYQDISKELSTGFYWKQM